VTDGRRIARNALFNLGGQGAPLLLAVITIPLLISGLGADRFAILTLAWTAIGYFSIADFGLASALTQAVATRVGREEERDLCAVSWTALILMLGLGLLGALTLAAITPWLIHSVLDVPGALGSESVRAFYLIALSLPFLVTAAGMRGIVEAHQQFGTATILRLPFALFTFVGPLLVLPFSRSLVPIVGVLVAGRVVTWVGFAFVSFGRYEFLRRGPVFSGSHVAPLFRFGGWLTLSNIISPIMVNLDRFVIGALLPLAAVAYYVTASEVVIKLFIIPFALNAVLFPAMASAFARDAALTGRLLERGLRIGLLAMFPLVLTLVTFAHEGLTLWVGAEFADQGHSVLRWLAAAIIVSAPGQLASLLLHAAGRTDLPARAHMIELPIYAAGVWFLAGTFGITGVAIAWFLRLVLDSALMLGMAFARVPLPRRDAQRLAVLGAVLLVAIGAGGSIEALTTRLLFWAATLLLFIPVAWRYVLDDPERALVRGIVRLSSVGTARNP
jgi:O-antigen/teichoic acid export membrane protein